MYEKSLVKGRQITGATFFRATATAGANTEVSNDIQSISYSYTEHRFLRGDVRRSGDVYFIPWSPGGINYVFSNGRDVISGPFTGCIMASYTKGGARRVCHVATPECNAAWQALKAGSDFTLITEFAPADPVLDRMGYYTKKLTGGLYVLGLITADDKCYSAVLSEKGTNSGIFTVTDLIKVR